MNLNNNTSACFSPVYIHRVIERKTTSKQHRDGSIERTMTEIIVVQHNEDAIAHLLAENTRLKEQLKDFDYAKVPIDFENYASLVISLLLYWQMLD